HGELLFRARVRRVRPKGERFPYPVRSGGLGPLRGQEAPCAPDAYIPRRGASSHPRGSAHAWIVGVGEGVAPRGLGGPAQGKVTVNVAPRPIVLSASTVPPIDWTIPRT